MQQLRRRNRMILGLLALGLLAGAALTTSPVQAASGVAPYFAEPAWDRKMPASARFLILTNWNSEAVLDKETGLVWERSPSLTPDTWENAKTACLFRTTGNRQGWRLPSIYELASLIDPTVAAPGPTLMPGHPFLTVQSAFYWSATTREEFPYSAWDVRFGTHFTGLVGADTKTLSQQVWCVRGGGGDAYQY